MLDCLCRKDMSSIVLANLVLCEYVVSVRALTADELRVWVKA